MIISLAVIWAAVQLNSPGLMVFVIITGMLDLLMFAMVGDCINERRRRK